ncbi:hypothetical protein AGDE_14158 [Angomonas deanei]|nr:hypothetical protein AGDE_14158 [Angomonas deanei]|eukprot:EPY21333.1 hypothetical protein AGDE_14158 [Angomonas deanei]
MQLEIQQPGKTLEEVYTSDDFYLGRDAKRTSQTTPIVVLLKSSKGREMYLRVILTASNKLVITTPFLLLNHTPLDLTLRECTTKGEITSTRANANYYELPRNMNKPFVACPKDYAKGKEDFFVSLYTSEFSAKAVPLHVQQRGLILMMGVDNKGKAREITSIEDARKMEEKGMQVIHLAYLSKIQEMGYLLVEISPRWVVVNRSAFPLYVSGNRHVSLNAAEVQAAAQAVLEAKKAEDPEKRSIRSGGSSTALDDEVHKIQRGLEQLVDNSSFRMSVKDTVLVEPDTAWSFTEHSITWKRMGTICTLHPIRPPRSTVYQ